MKIHTTKLTGFHGDHLRGLGSKSPVSWTFIGRSTSALICSFSEAQKGAEDKGQIKAPLGGMHVRGATIK